MPITATRSTAPTPTLHLAFDLGNRIWKLAFATSIAHAPRLRTMPARELSQLDAEIALAKARFGLAPDAPVVSCYEAGRDGFWLHRALTTRGLTSHIVDSASSTENRRARRAKSDRLDATALVRLLLRHHAGERGVWSVVHVPSVAEEDRRHLHRELFTLTRQRPRQVNRSKGLRALHGIVLAKPRGLPARQPELCDWNGAPLPPAAAARVAREWTRLRAIQRDVVALRTTRRQLLDAPDAARDPLLRQVEQLCALRGIGEVSAWLYATEFFGWRAFRNRRQVAGLAGLTPPTRSSGDLEREPGISKAGNARIRGLAVELAWSWVRRQPTSALARWYRARCAAGGGRQRRIGIVAVARKLLIALWRYLETGVVPEGAVLKA
jgi:transposase